MIEDYDVEKRMKADELFGGEGILQTQLGRVGGLVQRLRLAWNLFNDPRVNIGPKAIPVLALLYILSPIDLIPAAIAGPLGLADDIVVLIFALDAFIRMCPAPVVAEHTRRLGLEKPSLPGGGVG